MGYDGGRWFSYNLGISRFSNPAQPEQDFVNRKLRTRYQVFQGDIHTTVDFSVDEPRFETFLANYLVITLLWHACPKVSESVRKKKEKWEF